MSNCIVQTGMDFTYTFCWVVMDLSNSSCLPCTNRHARSKASLRLRAAAIGFELSPGESAAWLEGVVTMTSLGVEAAKADGVG